jgi:RimJ/RimL family protein N-acetyltransferase
VFAAHSHGKGYATEAVRAALAWGDERFQKARTVCLVNPENSVSRHVAQKCGYREFHRGSYKGQPTLLFERLVGQ